MRGETVKIAILGGTGEQGPGLALRWAMVGEEVIIGSRSQERAEKVAAELNAELGQARIRGLENSQAAEAADLQRGAARDKFSRKVRHVPDPSDWSRTPAY